MKTIIEIDKWNRKEHYLFFSKFEEPFFGVTVKVDCTKAYLKAKEEQVSFFLYYTYRALKAANKIENFRYRIVDDSIYKFDTVNASPVISRSDGTFGFAYLDYFQDEKVFYERAKQNIENVKNTNELIPAISGENIIHISVLPWIDFTSMSHARCYSYKDSCPKMTFGKITENDGVKTMPLSIHVNHALMDGYHVGEFVELFQSFLNE